jgi:small GTP-binding protein
MGFENYGQTILVKCALLGDAAVGKSAITQALVSDGTQFPKNYSMTTSLKLNQKTVQIENSDDEVCLIIFDLAGEDVFETLIEPHFDLIGIFIVVFDLTNRTSFDNTTKWVSKLRALGVNVKGYLIGNKNDVNQDRQVITDKEAQKLATQLGLKYHKTSARENTGITESFTEMCTNVYNEWSQNPDSIPILTEQ